MEKREKFLKKYNLYMHRSDEPNEVALSSNLSREKEKVFLANGDSIYNVQWSCRGNCFLGWWTRGKR